MTEKQAFDRVVAFMAERFEIDGASVKMASRFYEDLDLDSIDAIDMAIELREMTGQDIEEEDLRRIRTVSDVINLVMRLQAEEQAG